MRELSIFIDESGDAAFRSEFYLVTLVFHEQESSLSDRIERYENALSDQGLDRIPFHFNPLLNGNDDYKWKSLCNRKRQLAAFTVFVQHLPVSYATFVVDRRGKKADVSRLSLTIERQIEAFLKLNLDYLQNFDRVKIYYDDGQSLVTKAIHQAIEDSISKQAIIYKDSSPRAYRLAQVADYLCGIELVGAKFERGLQTKTDVEFFGGIRDFKKNYLKKMRRKRMN